MRSNCRGSIDPHGKQGKPGPPGPKGEQGDRGIKVRLRCVLDFTE